MPRDRFPDHEFKPRNLTKEEIKQPHLVVYDFFSMSHLPEHREQLTQVFDLMITGNYNKTTTRRERSDIVYFFRNLEKLIEAVHIISERGEMLWGKEAEIYLNDLKNKETTT